MEISQPPFGRLGSRTLAAIVFTDVVSFSARMQRDEVKTLALVTRDFAEMRRLCTARGGAVLKTTGDGLLCYFASAVEAVACALEMQRHFASLEKTLPAAEVLQHRIGIHLGDVLVQEQDVMGDGVNIAARLQAEAEPGGICISQTVYDVVKNKLELQATYLGARELKNIAHAVPIYHILLEAQARNQAPGAGTPATKNARWLWAAAGLALSAGVGALLYFHHPTSVAPAAQAPAAKSAPTPAAASGPEPKEPAAPVSGNLGAERNSRAFAARREFLQEIREPYLVHYDFDGLLQAMQSGKIKVDSPYPLQFRRSIEHMAEMKSWFLERLSHYTAVQPLIVPRFAGGGEKDYRVYGAPPDKIMVVSGGTPATQALADLKPPFFGLLLMAAIKNDPAVPNDVLLGASVFARYNNLSEMELELQPMSAGGRPNKK
ncbi:MAG TPA: adenylate/guanylate cyclase domain-containing protein [Opitutaceae bacterium]|nr:adenylate/guanylate cyclase domain-containing protein [Opitutaceae bacterium]